MTRFVIALLLTVAVEVPLSLLVGMRRKELITVLLVNCLTNPIAMLLYWVLCARTSLSHLLLRFLIEATVVLTEGWIYARGTDRKHPYLCSLALNAASYGVGALLGYWNVFERFGGQL